jgi:serine/threonine-protein kinase
LGVATLPLEPTTGEEDDSGEAMLAEAKKRVGTTLRGKWTLERLIGVGGMGAVYEARHRNGMRGAVKVLDVALSRTSDCRKRFLREGRMANEVLDDDEMEDGSAFLVMELLEGATLDQLAMESDGVLPPEKVLAYAAQVLDTLVAAHARGIVHRDIKPENLLLTNEGIVKILDFGIARWNALGESQRVTQAGEPIGTPAFMAPEQARGHWSAVDAQSDVYSLGATMFTLATGASVHDDATTVAELLVSVITQPARPVKQAGAVPDALAEVIDTALSYDKRGRFVDALEMRRAIEGAYVELTGNPIPPTPMPAPVSDVSGPVTPAKMLRRRPATTVGHRRRGPMILAFAIPCAAIVACAAMVNASAHTRTIASAPTLAVTQQETLDVPPPPPIDDSTPPVAETRTVHPTAAPVSRAPVNVSRASETPHAPVVSPLSRRSSIYDRRL